MQIEDNIIEEIFNNLKINLIILKEKKKSKNLINLIQF